MSNEGCSYMSNEGLHILRVDEQWGVYTQLNNEGAHT